MHPKYEEDFYGWAMAEANLLRQRRLDDLDFEHLIEELESMGASERRELVSRLAQLLMHLLKWHYQPSFRGRSWEISIKKQRAAVKRIFADSPSLKSKMNFCLGQAYEDAVYDAIDETGLDEKTFPIECPYTFEQCLDDDFFPE